MTTFKVAAAQLAPVFLDREKTLEKACAAIREAAGKGARLIVFPEAFIAGYPDWIWLVPNSQGAILNQYYRRLLAESVSIPDEHTDRLCEAARENRIQVAIGLHERNAEASNGSLYNSLLFIGEDGRILGKRRKLIPTGGERLIWAQGDGSTLQVHETPIGRLGGLICWENLMPLARFSLFAQGMQVLVAPTWDKSPNWLNSMQHIAREGGVFVISCCMALHRDSIPDEMTFKELYPKDREWLNAGNSCIVSPKGQILAGPLSGKEGLLYADIDLGEIDEAKRMFDVAGHYARPDVFQLRIDRRAKGNLEAWKE